MGNLPSTSLQGRQSDEFTVYAILNFLDWDFRLNGLKLLSKTWRGSAASSAHYAWMCRRLQAERCLYVCSYLPAGESWERLFRRMWQQKNLFQPSTSELQDAGEHPSTLPPQTDNDNIAVAVRFRPATQRDDKKDEGKKGVEEDDVLFLLPLHQRLQLIKQKHDTSSSEEALKILFDEGGWRPGMAAKWKKSRLGENKENVDGTDETLKAMVHSVDAGMGSVVMLVPKVGMREFHFDYVLPGRTSQSFAYETVGRKLVMDFLNGYNATIVMYGQTGSGKTHTMFGPTGEQMPETALDGPPPKHLGIVPRAVHEVLLANESRRARGKKTTLSVSYVEIYGSDVTDLLRDGKRVGHNKVGSTKYVLDKKCAVEVKSLQEVYHLLNVGDLQKRKAATAMNDRSSRAHALFILNLDMEDEATNVCVRSQLFLADLGGSEQVKRSKVHHGHTSTDGGFTMGKNMREAVNINLGLLALKKVTRALNNPEQTYIPYQDSKLTMLLAPALGGDSKAAVVVCASMESANAEETMQALRFGEQCSRVENQASQRSSAILHVIKAIDAEIEELEATIKENERWEVEETVREDVLAEAGTYEAQAGGEIVKTGKIVGAEAERERLEALIRRRAEITGEEVELKLAEAGFGGKYGGKVDSLGGNAASRYNANDGGLMMKGRKVAQWQD